VAEQTSHLELVVPALAEHLGDLRAATRAFAARNGVAHPERAALAVSEAGAKALAKNNGAQPGELRLLCDRYADRVVFVVEGDGRGFAPQADGPELSLPMMAGLSDHVLVGNGNGGGLHTEITFALH
jgi:hypothetical protein